MEIARAHKAATSTALDSLAPRGLARQCVVIDRGDKQMVMPRCSAAHAIEQIAKAIAGRNACSEEKRRARERLRDQRGFSVKWIRPKLVGGISLSTP